MGQIVQLPTLANYKARFNEAATPLVQSDIIAMVCDPALKQKAMQQLAIGLIPLTSRFQFGAAQNILAELNAPLIRGFQRAEEEFNAGHSHEMIRLDWKDAVRAAATCAAAQAAKEARTAKRPSPPSSPRRSR